MTKVLVVDDDPLACELASELIRQEGHDVWEAADGENALRLVREIDPQVLILDVRMPGMDGFQVCRQLRSDIKTSAIYIIMLSARDKTFDKVMGLDMGADAYLTKPYAEDELMAHIRVAERTVIDRHMAMHDALTGLFNRRAFDELLAREMASCRRYGGTVSLVTIDIDHFKKVNDTYGHDVGDEVLKDLANILRNVSRPSDLPCRWGGEEFSWLLPKTDVEGARQAGERLRQAVSGFDFSTDERQTISMGVAELRSDETSDALCRRADLALYEAKETGRNKVVVFKD